MKSKNIQKIICTEILPQVQLFSFLWNTEQTPSVRALLYAVESFINDQKVDLDITSLVIRNVGLMQAEHTLYSFITCTVVGGKYWPQY